MSESIKVPVVLCICCGHRWPGGDARTSKGPIHFDCWNAHHSDPGGPWPPEHRCDAVDG